MSPTFMGVSLLGAEILLLARRGATLEAVEFELSHERAPRDPEELGGARLVAAALRERIDDPQALVGRLVRERGLREDLRLREVLGRGGRRGEGLELLELEVLGADEARVADEGRVLDRVPQLAHVPGPRVAEEDVERLARELGGAGALGVGALEGEALDEDPRERLDLRA